MSKRKLESLGTMIKARRGEKSLRNAAKEIGVGAATLMRIESGHMPDIHTFSKVCKWLEVDPGEFLGYKPTTAEAPQPDRLVLSAHFRADRTPKAETVAALAKMIMLAAEMQSKG